MDQETQVIKQPKKLILIGDPNILTECSSNNQEKELDIVPESLIVYSDLVFTLKNNDSQYFRPVVRYVNGKLSVVSNRLFHRAAKEAGIDKVLFDLLLSHEIPLEQLIERYSLEFPPGPKRKNYLERFLFFRNTPRGSASNNSQVIMNPENSSQSYLQNNCISYRLLLYEDPKTAKQIETELVARLSNENGYLRSINGLRDKSCGFGEYII
jgi:hypothetical protein